jgi:hypothetical protein
MGRHMARHAIRPVVANVLDGYKLETVDRVDVMQFKILFNHENRIRALEGRGAVTAQQFKSAVAALL